MALRIVGISTFRLRRLRVEAFQKYFGFFADRCIGAFQRLNQRWDKERSLFVLIEQFA